MSLSAEDIVGYRFKQSLRGYAIDEVDELLDQLADQVERMGTELEQLRERVRVAEEQAASATRTETALRRTLVTAQETAERVVAEAEREAAAQRAEAAAEAERLRTDARREADEVVQAAEASARREATAARERVADAVERHRAVLEGVAAQRDRLRAHLGQLDRLIAAGVPEVAREGEATELIAGELPAPPSSGPADAGGEHGDGASASVGAEVSAAAGAEGERHERSTEGLKVRVHEDASEHPPLGSEPRGGR